MKALALGILAALTLPFGFAILQEGNTWSVDYGDPNSDGEHTTSVTISYIDSTGVKKTKEVSATVALTNGQGAVEKKDLVQGALNDALAEPVNQVGGNSLAVTGGTGDVMTITPAGNPSDGSFTDAKIERLKTKDQATGEKDKVHKPAHVEAVAVIEVEGDLTGLAGGKGSVFEVETDLGTVSVALSGGIRRSQLLEELRSGLAEQGARVWLDPVEMVLYVLLEDESDEDESGIGSIAVGSTDEGLHAVLTVIAP